MGLYDAMEVHETARTAAEKPTLLIVDDEAGPRESLRIVFKDRYNCAIATCGREGIEFARNHKVDAAILDIKMPDLSGVDVLREIKRIDPNTECVMLTGYETLDSARAAVRFGAAEYLNKPFDVFAIRDLITKCIDRRLNKLTMEHTLHELHRMNEELSRELAQSNRAIAAGLLSAGVVHEMNNPLAIIAGYAQLLGRDLTALAAVDEKTAQHVKHRLASIQREIERCRDIAKRFLQFSRASHATVETIEVAKLLADTAALVKAHPANKGVEIVVRGGPDLKVKVHPAEILQVFINLCVNALQAMNGTGTLQLSAEAASTPPADCAFKPESFDPQRPLVKISVTDTGSGIAPDHLKKIFQPYYTTKEHGTGVGLAIVCQLVNNYGGLIDVQSTVGQGSTFSVYLPA